MFQEDIEKIAVLNYSHFQKEIQKITILADQYKNDKFACKLLKKYLMTQDELIYCIESLAYKYNTEVRMIDIDHYYQEIILTLIKKFLLRLTEFKILNKKWCVKENDYFYTFTKKGKIILFLFKIFQKL